MLDIVIVALIILSFIAVAFYARALKGAIEPANGSADQSS